jgi:hypothetical protein
MAQEDDLRDRLEARLTARWVGCSFESYHRNATKGALSRWRPGLGYYDALYEGDHELGFATAAYWEAFGPYLAATADNFMPLVVDAAVERLRVLGFRWGKATGADDATNEIWQANDMDLGSDQLHREAGKLGFAYWMVDRPPARGDAPLITPEQPNQVIVQCSAANPRVREAAFKMWAEPDGFVHCNLYTRDKVFKWRRPAAGSVELPYGVKADTWVLDAGDSGAHATPGYVPVVPVPNTPRLGGQGISDLKDVAGDQTNINKLLADMLLTSEYMAFPQRVLLGIEEMVGPDGKTPLTAAEAQLAVSRSRLLRLPAGEQGAEPKIDQWDAVDLENYVKARNHLLDGMFSKGRLPINYNARGQLANISADALRAAEKNLYSRCEMKLPGFDTGHEDTMRLAHRAMGNREQATAVTAEVLWRPLEARTEAELVDAATKKQAMGIPLDIILEDLGYSPQKIERIQALRMADDAFGGPEADLAAAASRRVEADAQAQAIASQVAAATRAAGTQATT